MLHDEYLNPWYIYSFSRNRKTTYYYRCITGIVILCRPREQNLWFIWSKQDKN